MNEALKNMQKLYAPSSLSIEIWFSRAIKCRELIDGVTTFESRREHARRHILENGLTDDVIGHKNGREVTIAEAFAAIYECSLEPEKARAAG